MNYEITEELNISKYNDFGDSITQEILESIQTKLNQLHRRDSVKKNFLLMIINYIYKYENHTNQIILSNLNKLTSKIFTNYIPLIPGINISKFIINANQDLKYITHSIYNLLGSSNIIAVVKDMKKSIFILTMSEYIYLKKRNMQNIEFYTIVGQPLQKIITLSLTLRQKLFIYIIGLTNGKYNYEECGPHFISSQIQEYMNDVKNFINDLRDDDEKKLFKTYINQIFTLIFDDVKSHYKSNYTFKNETDIDEFEYKFRFRSKYLKYKTKYTQLKNKIEKLKKS